MVLFKIQRVPALMEYFYIHAPGVLPCKRPLSDGSLSLYMLDKLLSSPIRKKRCSRRMFLHGTDCNSQAQVVTSVPHG